MIKYIILLIALLLNQSILLGASVTEDYLPTIKYKATKIAGFTVLINPEVLLHQKEYNELLVELKTQLEKIIRVVPRQPLEHLKQVRIWVEWRAKADGAAEFHPSAAWLTTHGYNPEKEGSIEISNTINFVQWSHGEQPWMVMHEMAHAYHIKVLGDNFADIASAYNHAIDHKLYQSVDYIKGFKQRAYALTNSKEYFAELSEAYFGKNDFFPFTNSELANYDLMGYKVMVTVWGKL